MKTPREILLGKHQHEGPALDTIRRHALSQAEFGAREELPAELPRLSLAELLFRLRWHLAALAGIWGAIALLSILAAAPQNRPPQHTFSFIAQRVTVARENRQLLKELLKPATAETSAAMPGANLPRSEALPRSTFV
jgi:hypothetical protein